MKPFICLLLLVLTSCPSPRAQKPPDRCAPNASCPFQSGPYRQRMTSGPDAYRFQEQMNALFLMGVQPQVERSLPVAGTVSARELLIPAKAIKEFKRGRKAYVANDFKRSAEHFEKAVQMYPDFAEAHNNLGSSYLMGGASERSLGEFEKAIALDPTKIDAYDNLSLALLLLKRYSDSEVAARRALQIDPRHVISLSLLGNALAAQQHYTQEAVDSLRQSRSKISGDRLTLVEVLLKRGELDQAVAELSEYLQVAPDPQKQQVRCWLAHLTQTDISRACRAQ